MGFANGSSIIGIGIGVEIGAIFIVLMGMFFVATEEMVETILRELKIKKEKRPSFNLVEKPFILIF